jgi:hypothetical protein
MHTINKIPYNKARRNRSKLVDWSVFVNRLVVHYNPHVHGDENITMLNRGLHAEKRQFNTIK